MLLPFCCSDAGGEDAGTLRGPVSVLSALLFARVSSSFARIAETTLCTQDKAVLSRHLLSEISGLLCFDSPSTDANQQRHWNQTKSVGMHGSSSLLGPGRSDGTPDDLATP